MDLKINTPQMIVLKPFKRYEQRFQEVNIGIQLPKE
jgi:hypothetical protein